MDLSVVAKCFSLNLKGYNNLNLTKLMRKRFVIIEMRSYFLLGSDLCQDFREISRPHLQSISTQTRSLFIFG
jgi:hypothetical protein